MSRINEIKKKAKLSIDEMYDNQLVGKLDVHKNGSMEIKQAIHPDTHTPNQPDIHLSNHTTFQETSQTTKHMAGQTTIHPQEKLENHPDVNPEFQIIRQGTLFSNPKSKIQTYKMTFNLTEEIYKSFNDLYANRMLQGRKTEKSELICEAIRWLIKMENEQS